MPAAEWSTMWTPFAEDGSPLGSERLPLMIALAERRPAHSAFWINGLDGTRRHIEATAFPLTRVTDEIVGAVVIFWEAAP
jgi:hypothetical protein